MNNLTNEQLISLITNVSGFDELSENELCEVEAWWLQGAHEALKEILTLRERVKFYKKQHEQADIECNRLAMRVATLEEAGSELLMAGSTWLSQANRDAQKKWYALCPPQPPKESSDE